MTDTQLIFRIDLPVRFHVSQQDQPVYCFTFSYDIVLNLAKIMVGVEKYSGIFITW